MSRSLILTYHSIDRTSSVISVSPEQFQAHARKLAQGPLRVVPLEEVRQAGGGAAAITFDDGFRNFREHALPALAQANLPATVFVISGYCGGRNNWPTQPAGSIPTLDLMSWSELEELAQARVTLGAHTVNHPFLTRLSDAEIVEEFRVCQDAIEQRTGRPATSLAYPYGDWNPRVRQAAAPFFQLACTTDMRFLDASDDPLALPRMDAYYVRNPLWFEKLGEWTGELYLAARAWVRSLR